VLSNGNSNSHRRLCHIRLRPWKRQEPPLTLGADANSHDHDNDPASRSELLKNGHGSNGAGW